MSLTPEEIKTYISEEACAVSEHRSLEIDGLIKDTLERYYFPDPVDLDEVARIGAQDIYPDGSSVFRLGMEELVRIGSTFTELKVEGGKVTIAFKSYATLIDFDNIHSEEETDGRGDIHS